MAVPTPGRLPSVSRGVVSAACVSACLFSVACAPERKTTEPGPTIPSGPRFYLEIVPEDGVFIQDSVHCVVAEGPFSVPWRVMRDSTAGTAEVQVTEIGRSAVADEDFELVTDPVRFGDGEHAADRSSFPYIQGGGMMIQDDDRPEPDEQFLITLVDPSSGYHVDPVRGSITVTIIDDDQPQSPVPVFLFPLDEGDSWAYRVVSHGWETGDGPWSGVADQVSGLGGARIFKGKEYARWSGWEDVRFFRQEGAGVFLVPGDQNQDPPAEQDTLAFGRWQHLPWHLFDASAAVPLAAEGLADTVCWHPQYGGEECSTLSEGAADHGWSAIAVPAGIFRRVRRVSFHTRKELGGPAYSDGAEFTWYIADSVGIVCELDHREADHGGGSYTSYLERKFLTGFAAPGRPGLPCPRQP